MKPVLILGSAPNAMACRDVPKSMFSAIVAINNAWQVRGDWDYHIAPDDFPQDRMPDVVRAGQTLVGSDDYVPANNEFGGIVYAGATMAFTAGYWALARLKPTRMVFFGCDMVYPKQGNAHFYGTGTADPLRDDVTLRNLEAKSTRLMLHAAQQGCTCLRAPAGESRLVFPATDFANLGTPDTLRIFTNPKGFERAAEYESALGYYVESGRYWESTRVFSTDELDAVDQMWLNAARGGDAPAAL